MSEIKPPKKMVSRSVAIALGIICIILVAGLGVVLFMAYSPTSGSSITTLQSQFNDLNATYNGYVSAHSHTDSDYNSLNTQNTNLQSHVDILTGQVDDLNSTLTLSKSTIWVDGDSVSVMGLPPTYEESASFAGYVSVQVFSPVNTTVEVWYLSNGVSYENSTIVGWNGTVVFPVLPSNISFYILQTPSANPYSLTGPINATVTITYYY
jgi:hypothetical protein